MSDDAERVIAARQAQANQEATQREESRKRELFALIALLAPYAAANIIRHNYPTGDMLAPRIYCYTNISGGKGIVWGSRASGVNEHGEAIFIEGSLDQRPHARSLHEYDRRAAEFEEMSRTLHNLATSLIKVPVPPRPDCTWQCYDCSHERQHYDYPVSLPAGYPIEELNRVLGMELQRQSPRRRSTWLDRLLGR